MARDRKTETMRAYSAIAGEVKKGYDDYFQRVVRPEAERFLERVPRGGLIVNYRGLKPAAF